MNGVGNLKKSCKGCRALEGFEFDYRCTLGYRLTVDTIGEFYGRSIYQAKPLEDCPKPKTYNKYFELHDENN